MKMIYSFSDFLTDNSVIIIVLILGAILGVTYYLKRNVLSKYNHNDEDEDQTPEEILQDELDSLLVTEKYNPNAEKAKKDILDEDDDDFDYDNNVKKEVEHDDNFTVDTDVSFSFQTFDDNNEK
jgi:hypothetical protein